MWVVYGSTEFSTMVDFNTIVCPTVAVMIDRTGNCKNVWDLRMVFGANLCKGKPHV